MLSGLVVTLSLQLAAVTIPDSARLVDDTLVIEPLGFWFRVPALWLGRPGPPGLSFCDVYPTGTISDRIVTDRRSLPRLKHPRGEWTREYAAVVDSVLEFGALVAHLGGDPWNGTCGAPQMRVYIRDTSAAPVRTLAHRGVEAAERVFPPVTRMDADSSGWALTRLSWQPYYYDYGGTAQVEFWSRPVRDRLVTLVFMYIPYVVHHRAMLTDILQSVHY